MPAWWLGSVEVSMGARVLLGMVAESATRGRRCAPGFDALAALLHVHTRSVKRYVRELRERGYVVVCRRGRGHNAVLLLSRALWRRFTGRTPRPWGRPIAQTVLGLVRRLAAPVAGWEVYHGEARRVLR